MSPIIASLAYVYSRLLLLYPGRFRDEFAEEMRIVFMDAMADAAKGGKAHLAVVFLKELLRLPMSVLWEYWHEVEQKELEMIDGKETNPKSKMRERTNRWESLVGTTPFALFGFACMLASSFPFQFRYIYIAFYLFALIGLTLGLTKGVPRWTYSYLGWSMVMSWWWMAMPIDVFRSNYSSITHNQLLGWRSWLLLLAVIGFVLPRSRSLQPLRRLVGGIWQRWTYLSLMMYTFVAFTQLIYDENHHPYLIAFMIGSTVSISLGAWLFLQSTTVWKRILSLIAGFVFASLIGSISYATWDWAAYYGFPPSAPEPWYVSAVKAFLISPIWIMVLFWPALVGLARRIFHVRKAI
jgi:hypothetical protein